MNASSDACRHCGAHIPNGGTVYGDHNRKFCSEACALAQVGLEHGGFRARGGEAVAQAHPLAGDRVGRGAGPARTPGRGPTSR